MRHVDVSLWFAPPARVGHPLHPDQRESSGTSKWWCEVEALVIDFVLHVKALQIPESRP